MAQEIALLSGLYSPYIVRFLGASVTPGREMFMFSEFCERGDLYHAIQIDAEEDQTRQLGWQLRWAVPGGAAVAFLRTHLAGDMI